MTQGYNNYLKIPHQHMQTRSTEVADWLMEKVQAFTPGTRLDIFY
jgi:hypothetical protein